MSVVIGCLYLLSDCLVIVVLFSRTLSVSEESLEDCHGVPCHSGKWHGVL